MNSTIADSRKTNTCGADGDWRLAGVHDNGRQMVNQHRHGDGWRRPLTRQNRHRRLSREPERRVSTCILTTAAAMSWTDVWQLLTTSRNNELTRHSSWRHASATRAARCVVVSSDERQSTKARLKWMEGLTAVVIVESSSFSLCQIVSPLSTETRQTLCFGDISTKRPLQPWV